VKTDKKIQTPILGGTWLGYPSPDDSCTRLENFKYDDGTKAWHNMFGLEKFFSNLGPFPSSPTGRVHSLYCYTRHQGAQQYYMFEQGGTISYVNGSVEGYETLFTGVKPPVLNQPPAQFCEFGPYVVCVGGGRFPAFKFRGGQPMPLGWNFKTANPIAFTPEDNFPLIGNQYFIQSPADYEQPESGQLGGGAAQDQEFGCLGSLTAGDFNTYTYKVSAVNEAGSESPLSTYTAPIRWETVTITKPSGNVERRTAVLLDDIFVGPPGTSYRKIYRTRRNGTEYYFCNIVTGNKETKYVDYVADNELGALAPDETESVPFPAPTAQVCASFKGCLFLDGGRSNPTRIFYSKPLQPDTFGAFDYFDVGTRQGGSITGLYAYYNVLLVFRERAIDIVSGDPVNGFSIAPFIDSVGTRSPSTITVIPNVGVIFLGDDGVYLIGGNFQSLKLQIEKVSGPIDEIFERMNRAQLPKSVAAWHPEWKEWQCYISVGGDANLSLGIVYHQNGTWSTRQGFNVSAITVDSGGNAIIGCDIGVPSSVTPGTKIGNGLMVLSGLRNSGYVAPAFAQEEPVEEGPLKSSFRSRWHDFGYPAIKKHVKYIYLYLWTTGNNPITVTWYRDRDWTPVASTTSPPTYIQRADHPDQPVYGGAKWGSDRWQDKLMTQIRIDVGQFGCSDFAFEFETDSPIVFTGYAIELNTSMQETIGAKRG